MCLADVPGPIESTLRLKMNLIAHGKYGGTISNRPRSGCLLLGDDLSLYFIFSIADVSERPHQLNIWKCEH
jgi:hypothetical protein